MTIPVLEITGLSKHYGEGKDRTDVLKDVNLKVGDGEFIAIVGFSGSGKTTLISALAGLTDTDQGGVVYRGREIAGPAPERGVVFQSYSLMPWLTVQGNVALAVDSVFSGKPRAERKALADKYIDMVGLGHARDRKPAELSGGMRQRVAVARALANDPLVILADEPTGNLDQKSGRNVFDIFERLVDDMGTTIIAVTHDEHLAALTQRQITIVDGVIHTDHRVNRGLPPTGNEDRPGHGI